MFQFLQRNSSLNYIILLFAVLLLWGGNIINPQFVPQYYDTTPMPLYEPFMAVQNWNPMVGQLLMIAILMATAFTFFKISMQIRLIEKRTIFDVVIFLIMSASLPEYRQMNPLFPALFFIILGMTWLFRIYKRETDLKSAFESGIFFSIATLFYAPSVYFSILVFVGLFTLAPFYRRQWLSGLVGLCLPMIVWASISFYSDTLPQQFEIIKANLLPKQHTTFNALFPLCFSGFLALLFVRSAVYAFYEGNRKVSIRKYYLMLVFMLTIVLAMFILSPYISYDFLFFGLLPTSIFVTNFMVNMRRQFITEILFWIILVFAVLVQVFPEVTIEYPF